MAKKSSKFEPSRAIEMEFYRALKKVAESASNIVEQYTNGPFVIDTRTMMAELERYAEKLGPWAVRQSEKMMARVSAQNKRAYRSTSKKLSREIQGPFAESNVMRVATALMNEQVGLIKSIPIEAGLRAQKIAEEAILYGRRAVPDEDTINQLQEQMGMTRQVAVNRAKLIAITETARASSSINQARAVGAGSRQYRWRNSRDAAVRDSHKYYKGKKLDGMVFSWDDPPTLDDGTTGHAGSFPRCRCSCEPIFDD